MSILAGILSDTHLGAPNHMFTELARTCFADCDLILHAGDLTDLSVLDVFSDKTVYAVYGNMCREKARLALKKSVTVTFERFTIGITHGDQLGYDIESGLWDLFPEADCMIYGHTHRAVCHRVGTALIINPGSFQSTGRFGAPGTYGLMEIGNTLRAQIHQVPQWP